MKEIKVKYKYKPRSTKRGNIVPSYICGSLFVDKNVKQQGWAGIGQVFLGLPTKIWLNKENLKLFTNYLKFI